jgi:hypothetical protein
LLIAALCQDCGRLLVSQRSGDGARTGLRRPAEIDELHPSVGAAVVAGICEYSLELPALVAGHHRRESDGDHAQGTTLRAPGLELLTSSVRFVELLEDCGRLPDRDEPAALDEAVHGAAAALLREAEAGEWDLEAAADLLGALGFCVQIEPIAERFDGREGVGGDRRRLDSKQRGPAGPHGFIPAGPREVLDVRRR